MPRVRERTTNTNDSTSEEIVAVNPTTAVKIADGNANRKTARIFLSVTNNSNADVWVRLRTALVDNLKKGVVILYPGCYWEMPPDEKYIGEVSAIAEDRDGEIVVCEY